MRYGVQKMRGRSKYDYNTSRKKEKRLERLDIINGKGVIIIEQE